MGCVPKRTDLMDKFGLCFGKFLRTVFINTYNTILIFYENFYGYMSLVFFVFCVFFLSQICFLCFFFILFIF